MDTFSFINNPLFVNKTPPVISLINIVLWIFMQIFKPESSALSIRAREFYGASTEKLDIGNMFMQFISFFILLPLIEILFGRISILLILLIVWTNVNGGINFKSCPKDDEGKPFVQCCGSYAYTIIISSFLVMIPMVIKDENKQILVGPFLYTIYFILFALTDKKITHHCRWIGIGGLIGSYISWMRSYKRLATITGSISLLAIILSNSFYDPSFC